MRPLNKPPRKSVEQVARRINQLQALNQPYMADRAKIRKLMNGGRGAVEVLLKGLENNEDTLPAANHIKSGIERFSEMISPEPDLRIDPPGGKDDDKLVRAAEKRERIVTSYDERCRLPQQLAQGSLWTPGYGFYSWKVCQRRDANGVLFPKAELRDPFSTYPAEWGVDQQPIDIAYHRYADPEALVHLYPHSRAALEAAMRKGGGTFPGGGIDLSYVTSGTTPGWDGIASGVPIYEYVDGYGTYVYTPVMQDQFLDVYEHPLDRGAFVIPKRFTFDNLQGQFTDVIGLASTMAKLTLLTQIIMEDAAFAPLFVTGRFDGEIEKGRDSVNVLDGGDAKYVTQNIPYQMFQEIDRIDGHLRSTTGYSRQADGESPISFVTGQGLEELGSALTRQVERYQLVFRDALQDLDAMRLEWDERAFGDEERTIEGTRKGADYSETYVPSRDIAGRWRTRRVYGLMAGLDEARRLVGLLQMLAAGVIDVQTVQENLRDIDNAPKVQDRILTKRIEDMQFEILSGMAAQGDPTAMRAVTAIKRDPKRMDEILAEFFEPQEEQDPMAAAMGAQASPQQQMSEVLTRLTAGGQTAGGVQTQRQISGGQGAAA